LEFGGTAGWAVLVLIGEQFEQGILSSQVQAEKQYKR